jgi:hypothetical protein
MGGIAISLEVKLTNATRILTSFTTSTARQQHNISITGFVNPQNDGVLHLTKAFLIFEEKFNIDIIVLIAPLNAIPQTAGP